MAAAIGEGRMGSYLNQSLHLILYVSFSVVRGENPTRKSGEPDVLLLR
jgi:hypothetical protein